MLIDARSIPSDETFETEVCIVGAGPAGITLARELMDLKFRVLLVESGGLESDESIQSLSDGKVIGDPYPKLCETRLRKFGGTAHYWEAPTGYKQPGWRCLPLDEIDFEQRDWLPHSGWPFSKSHLDPFYQRAHQVCQIGSFTYRVEDWEQPSARQLPLNSDRIVTTISQYASRTPFTQEYREELKQAENITVLLNATVLDIETDTTAQTVTRLQATSSPGQTFWISAKIFVLATGGIENARLLLLSNQSQKAGLGNQNDLVGRFFMDRPVVNCGVLIPNSRELLDQTQLYDIYEIEGVPIMARVQLTEELMRHEQLLNNGAQLFPVPHPHHREATQALRSLVTTIRQAKLPKNPLQQLGQVIRGIDYVAVAGFWSAARRLPKLRRGDWSYLALEKQRFSRFEVIYQIEQSPHPDNRVMLGNERDRLGQSKVEIHWKLQDVDLRTVKRVQEIWAEEFAQAKLGSLQINETLKLEKPAMHHHMGTTRMHSDSKQGVVDANCKVHDMTNLFISGSSVFPTSGYANPTLTIIALAIRLADHIKREID